jgi:dethiobiotin synthetase/adenosylmethionine--8-amino-7-oxononanoate aminotransferase
MLSRNLRSHLILAPSTSVGKSIIATSLTIASLSLGEIVAYCKPVGTGDITEDDELYALEP